LKNVALHVKSDMRAILDVNLPSRTQPIVELVPGGPGARHIRRVTGADQAIPACCVVLFRSTGLFGAFSKPVIEIVEDFYPFDT